MLKIKYIFCLILFMSFFCQGSYGYDIIFMYDASGNVIERHLNMQRMIPEIENMDIYQSNENYDIRIYPNPTDGHLTIDILEPNIEECVYVCLYSEAGTLIQDIKSNTIPLFLDISSQPEGIYFLYVNIDKFDKVWKIIKK